MADLNALIAQGYQAQPLPDPFAQYAKMQQMQNINTQNQLAQQQMAEHTASAPYRLAEVKARSGSAELELKQAQDAQEFVNGVMQKVAENHGGITDPMEAAQQMLLNPNPKVQMMGKHLAEAHQLVEGIKQQQRYTQRATAAAPTAAYAPTAATGTLGGPTPVAQGVLGSGTFDANAPVANALKPTTPTLNVLARPSAVTAESIAAEIRQGNAEFGNAPGWVKDRELLNEQYKALLNQRNTAFAPIDASKYTPASLKAFNLSGDQADLVAVIKDEKPVQPKLHVVGKNLVDETGKVVFKAQPEPGAGVPKAPAGYRVTAAGDLEAIPGGPAASKPMTALQQQAYKKDFANDTSNIKSAVDTANELETLTDTLVGNPDKGIKAHPGLGGITGYAGMLPSLPKGEAAKAEQKLETFKGKIKALGRTIASQQGKLGNMAVQEWQMVSDAVQAIKPTAGNLDEQMRDVVRQAKQLAKNMQDKFDLTYEEPPTAGGAPKPAGVGGKPAPTVSNW